VPLPPKIAPRAAKALTSETPKSLSLVLLWTNQVPVSVLYSSNLLSWQVVSNVANQPYQIIEPAPAYYRVRSVYALVTLAWDASPSPDVYYHIFTLSAGVTNQFDAGRALQVTLTLAPDTQYEFWATAYYPGYAESFPSASITYRTPAQTFLPARIRKQ
jgi:hypothetical protein